MVKQYSSDDQGTFGNGYSKSTAPNANTATSNNSYQQKQTALGGAKGVFKIIGAEIEADSIRKQANFQADIMQLNAELTEIDSLNITRQGIFQSNVYQTEADQIKQEQIAYFATTGQETTGAVGDVIAESSLNAALNQLEIENQAFMQASKYSFEAKKTMLNANQLRESSKEQARLTRITGYLGAGSDIATAAASGGAGGG